MQLLLMIKYQLKLLFRNRLAIFMMIAAPVLLTLLFSLVGSSDNKAQLGLVDLDHSASSKQLIRSLNKQENVKVIPLSQPVLQHDIGHQSVPVGLVIGDRYDRTLLAGQKLDLTLIQTHTSGSSALIDQAVYESVGAQEKMARDATTVSRPIHANKIALLSQFYRQGSKTSAVSVSDQSPSVQNEARQENLRQLIGFLVMFIWFVVFQGLRTMIEEKENHAFDRMISTPARYSLLVLAKMVATFIFSAFHIAAIILVAVLLFKLSLSGHLLLIIAIFAAYLFALIGLTMMVVPFFRKQQQFTILSTMIVVLTGMLGGSFFSIENFAPQFIVLLSHLVPESWAIQSLIRVMIDGQSLGAQWLALAVLGGAGCFGLMLSTITLRLSERRSRR
ncbi:MAG: ABC transporter permease [Sporolactobacillus sp.]